ncbi:MAG TPA: hypothetical protein PKY12_12480, partial [Catalimonadaceae bacterium]|nr:hypothetical protein [Catalimonadaceae bacterium]
ISHDKFTNKYLTYLVTSVGVNNTPLIFAGGTTDNGTSFPNLTSPNFGYMKASPDGNRIACAFSAKSRIDILNFDRATGQISFRFTLTQIPNAYGLEFSPNGKLLYATGYTGKNIRQYNLSLNTLTQVVAASVILRPRTHLNVWALQLGPDEKIYASRLGSGFLDCILHPNNVGTTCNFVEEAIYLDGKFASAGLPNFFPYFMQPSGITDRGFCPLDTTFFSIEAGLPPDSVKWNFGDPASGALNFSTSLSPYHVYQQGGTYPVTVLKFNGSVVDTLEKPVTILPQPYVNLGPDTTFCEGTSIELNAFAGSGYTYSWGSPTAIYPNITIVNQGPYAVTVSNSCGAWSDTIVAWKVNPPVPFSLGTDIEVCEGTLVQLNAAQANTKTIWQDGTFGPAFFPTTSGTYIAEVRNVCSSVKDTINVSFNPLPTVSLGPDVSFCNGDSVWIKPTGMADTYLWSTGSTADSITVSAAGVIYVRATNTCGTASDTLTARQIFSPQPVNLGPSNTLCENQVLILNAFQQGVSYTWQDGSTNPEFSVSDSGIYYVRVTNPCGTSSDTVFIQKIPNPSVTLGPDI